VLGAEPATSAGAGRKHPRHGRRSEWSDGRGSQAEACRRRSIPAPGDGFGKRWAVRVCQRRSRTFSDHDHVGGFCVADVIGNAACGESYTIPNTALAVAESFTDVEVGLSQIDVAEEQIKIEEKQRVLGVLPNFYVTYIPNAVPLTSKQSSSWHGRR